MKNKKSKPRISIKKFIINNFPKNEIKSNINLFLNTKYSSRNDNNYVSSKNHFQKNNLDSKFRNDKNGKEKLITLTEIIHKKANKIKKDEIRNLELNQNDNNNLKNKSSDDLPKKIKDNTTLKPLKLLLF